MLLTSWVLVCLGRFFSTHRIHQDDSRYSTWHDLEIVPFLALRKDLALHAWLVEVYPDRSRCDSTRDSFPSVYVIEDYS